MRPNIIGSAGEKDPRVHSYAEVVRRTEDGNKKAQRALLGVCLNEKLWKAGLPCCRVRPPRGKLVLSSASEKSAMDNLMSKGRELLSKRFVLVRPRSKRDVGVGRQRWIRVFGVPLHVWTLDFFRRVVSKWGEFIAVDDKTR
ncbi:hypothetical protein Ancab_008375 [Ancistrocladus abbreviatus]